ncbi:hypothetical protein HHL01_06120 [Pseudoalteromonas arctica]|uniref:Uncharacterized protein n=1 Tax=Pseudoalteromonas arctica TaxID=394751 RepID=A0A7X9U5W1_9GAMM|nr:hypothetical protein [Pseudoalteromonas arctica]NMF47753.1 hypothetical protein [Pseudoalteromonas arctica]|tara:strand:- start:1948 stop:2238 length:291 start_codon:yes stop_codon:yes gene_type:complete
MSSPPLKIDGAIVLEWAWSGNKPFGVVKYQNGEVASEIFGLAICAYPDSDQVYIFSCDCDWETEQDSQYNSIQNAKDYLPEQYRHVKANWKLSTDI